MKIKDPIYGEFEIKEPVLIELINSKPVQRLKNIDQNGLPKEYTDFPRCNRYDHSIGVMLILRKLGASVEEQIAGLLHDVAHTAFSHMIDWVIPNLNEDYHEKNHEKILMNSEIPGILKKYNFDINRIINVENYSLLENKIPDLCADRVEYSIREFYLWANPSKAKFCYSSLVNYNGKIILSSMKAAEIFAKTYLKCQKEYWSGTENKVQYYLFAKILKIALKEKIINTKDFYQDDNLIMKKLKESKNKNVEEIFSILKSPRFEEVET